MTAADVMHVVELLEGAAAFRWLLGCWLGSLEGDVLLGLERVRDCSSFAILLDFDQNKWFRVCVTSSSCVCFSPDLQDPRLSPSSVQMFLRELCTVIPATTKCRIDA
jgi:hypothetical protein